MKTWMKKLTALILIALLVIGSVNLPVDLDGESGEGLRFSVTEASAKGKTVQPKKVTIEGSKYVAKGKKIKLKAVVAPEGANQKVTWTSSNPAVAKVDQKGNVKGIKPGKVKITAASKDNPKKKKAYTVQVMAQAVKKVKISGAPETMTVGATVTLKAAPDPAKAAKSFEWKSSNTAIATVNAKGQVTAVAAGAVTITATATDGSKKKSSVTITVAAPEEPVTPTDPETPVTPPTDPETPVTPTDPDPQPQEKDDHTFDWTDSNGVTFTFAYHKASKTVTITKVTGASSGHFTIPAEVEDSIDNEKVTVSGLDDGALAGCDINYIEVLGTTTTLAGIDNVPYVLAPAGSQAATDAGSKYIQETKAEGGFLYDVSGTTAILLCPVDSGKALTTDGNGVVEIPTNVDGKQVTEISENALSGATNAESVTLSIPDTVESIGIDNSKVKETRKIATKVTITNPENKTELEAGETLNLAVIAETETGDSPTNDKIEWSTSNNNVATVSENGKVKAEGYGEVDITATAVDGGKSEKISLKVWNVPEGLAFSEGNQTTLTVGDDPIDFGITVSPAEGLNPNKSIGIDWSIDPTTAVEITGNIKDGFKLKGLEAAAAVSISATITGTTITTVNPFVVTVYEVPTSITINNKPTGLLTVEDTHPISCTILPDGANPEVKYSVDPENVVTVSDDGVITAVGPGTATVTAIAGTVFDSFEVTVVPKATGYKISGPEDMTLFMDEAIGPKTMTLTAAIDPEGAIEPEDAVKWSSDKPEVARVDETTGLVEAVSPGTATIIASAGGLTGEVTITVSDQLYKISTEGKVTVFKDIQNGVATIPATLGGIDVTELDEGLFASNTDLVELELPAGLEVIPASLCEGCTSLTKVTAPNTVVTIGAKAFKGCTALSEMVTK